MIYPRWYPTRLVLRLEEKRLEAERIEAELEAELYYEDYYDDCEDNYTDVEADANTLASCGWGTDEDYGYFGGEDF